MQTPLDLATQTQATPVLKNIEELTISIAAKNLNPTMLSADFLKFSGIVPNDWELARQPVTNPRGSQVSFKNGLNIIAQPGSISFVEAMTDKDLKQLQFAQVAQKYVQKLPNAEYQGLSISPKIIVPFQEEEDGGKKFISEKLLSSGPWREFGNNPPQAALNLFYQLDDCQLTLNINPARLQQPNETVISAVLFAGNFTYNLSNIMGEERIKQLSQKINNWDQDLDIFRELIYEKFLQKAVPQQETLFPQS
jgi:hypothetical protein